ncbi:MAG TPA: hypothetical protein VMM83_05180 [Longimicrobiales bacterium]|nr:hypothetical protein [Longimicrobiales bacterium]
MSNVEAEDGSISTLPDEYVRLEGSVRRLLDQMAGYRARTRLAEGKATELERALADVTSGALDPLKMRDGLRRLEAENGELRRRMMQAQERIERLIARFDFLEEEM